MFFVGDQPLLNKNDIEKMINVFKEDTDYIVIPKYKESLGNPVIYPSIYKEQILKLEGDKGGKSIIKSSDKIKYVDVCENTLFDIDNIDDFKNLLKRKQILKLEGDKGGKSIIKSSDKIKYVDVCENTLFDIDNIDDFKNLLKRRA